MSNDQPPARFSGHIATSVGLLLLLAAVFFLHTLAENRIDAAHGLRHRSFLLATELRQSSDDLTRMGRTYVVTGNPAFKQHYQDILAIRNGEKARPVVYGTINWDRLSLAGGLPSAESGQKVALLELMRQAGFVPDEFRKLEEAKLHSDELTELEFAAMRLAESGGAEVEANRSKALLMLMDEPYLQAKESIMKPIGEFSAMLDARTLAAVQAAKRVATALQYLFVAVGLGLVFKLWRTYAALRDTLGGSVDEVGAEIAKIGRGDFSAPPPAKLAAKSSVLGWLAETRSTLGRIEHERREADEKLKAALREAWDLKIAIDEHAAVATTDARGKITFVNQKFCEVSGYSREELIGKDHRIINSGHHPKEFFGDLWSTISAGKVWRGEIKNRAKDGSFIWEDSTIVPFLGADNRPRQYMAIRAVITERKQAEEKLREASERLTLATRAANVGIWDFDVVHNKLGWDDAMYNLYGVERAQFGGAYEAWMAGVHPEDRQRANDELQAALSNEQDFDSEFRVVWPDQSVHHLKAHGRVLRDAAGRAVRMLGTNWDITGRKQAMDALRASEERFRSLYENAVVGFYRTTPEGNVLMANPALLRMLGFTSVEELAQRNLEQEGFGADQSRAAFKERLEQEGQVTNFVAAWQRRDGSILWVSENCRAERDQAGRTRYYDGSVEDITERKQAEEERDRFFTLSLDLMCIASTDGFFQRLNPAFERTLGYTTEEMLKRPFMDFIHPDDVAATQAVVATLAGGVELVNFENRYRCKDGSYRWLLWTSAPAGGLIYATARDITERKQDEQMRQQLSAIVESAEDAVLGKSLEGIVRTWNPGAERLFGYRAEEMIGQPASRLFPNGRLDEEVQILGRIGAGEAIKNLETVRRRQDGSLVDVSVSMSPILDQQGKIVGASTIVRDISERKKAEEALKQVRLRLELILNSVGEGVHGLDAEGNILFENPAAATMFGWESSAMLGRHAHHTIHHTRADGTAYPVVDCPIFQTLQDGQVRQITDEVFWRQDGSSFPVEYVCSPMRNATGEIEGTVVVFRDVTERKRAEAAIRESQDALRLTLDAARIGHWSLDLVTHAASRSLQHDQLFGYAELLPEWSYEKFLAHVHPDDRARVDGEFKARVAAHSSWDFECRIQRRDGVLRWIWAHGNVFTNANGEPVRMLGMVSDITERKRIEEEIRELNVSLEQRVVERTTELEAANKELEAFSYSVSHDLRAPLRGIDSFSRMVIEDYGPKLDADGQRQLNVIRSEAQRMGLLIDELLSFSRLARQEVRSASFDMTTLFQSVFDELPAADRKHVREFRLQALPAAYGDRSMIRQVVVNLISNAVKYSSTVAAPALEISGDCAGGLCTYRVKDNGVGFDPRYAHKLFGVFQRLHAEHEFEGTGVGLAIVQRIVHRHGGTVAAEGKPNLGATFSFSLPAKKESVIQTHHGKQNCN